MNDLPRTITQAADGLRSGIWSAVELTKAFLVRVEAVDSQVKALLTKTESEALAAAKAADERLKDGDKSPLLGIPVVYKDNFLTSEVKTTAGSNILKDYIAQYNADVVDRLQNAGAVMLGKANLDAFAHGSSTENSDFGPTHNPWNVEYVPGGSSGGSAAAVAARECLMATGSDTGGSIRQPASFTQTVGLKPTYGRVSRFGVIAMGSSFDSIGHFTRTVEDSALVLQCTAGISIDDSTSSSIAVPDYQAVLGNSLQGVTIGIVDAFLEGVDPAIVSALHAAKEKFELLGASFSKVELPFSKYALAAYYILVPSELSSNLARFDGIRYGHSDRSVDSLLEVYEESREQGFGPEAKRRIMLGTYALSAGYYDAYYKRAQQARTLVKADFDNAFKDVDAILAPVSPTMPFKLGERVDDPLAMYLSDILTVPVNLAGVPSLALPCGLHDGLPIGMQLIGPNFSEGKLFNIGHQYQLNTDWHEQDAPIGERRT